MCNQSILDKLNILYPADGKVKKNEFYHKNTEAHKNIILKTVKGEKKKGNNNAKENTWMLISVYWREIINF